MMLKQEASTRQARELQQFNQAVAEEAAEGGGAVQQSAEQLAALSIEGYMADFKHLRVAPATTVQNLSYNPFQWQQQGQQTAHPLPEGGEATEALVAAASEQDVASSESDDDESWGEEGGDSSSGTSLFLSIWSTLDDLFSYAASLLREDGGDSTLPPAVVTNAASVDAGPAQPFVQENRLPVASDNQQVQQAMLTQLERGIKAAERVLDVLRLLQSRSQLTVYHGVKNRMLSAVNRRLDRCPSLKSSGWTLIGILLIDAIVTRKCLLSGSSPALLQEWGNKVETMAAGVLGGGHIAGSQLRMGDMKILRSFFDDL